MLRAVARAFVAAARGPFGLPQPYGPGLRRQVAGRRILSTSLALTLRGRAVDQGLAWVVKAGGFVTSLAWRPCRAASPSPSASAFR